MSKKLTAADCQKKHSDLLKKHKSVLCTSDGQAFYNTPEGKNHAQNHAAANKLEVMEIKAAKKTTSKKDK
jgi:hypothetical protein